MSELLKNNDYKKWLVELKTAIKQQQLKAAVAINSQLILLYWDMGRQIVEKQENAKWGSGFIDQLSKDLKAEFSDMAGFSADNLRYCKVFYLFYYNQLFHEQVVPEIGTKQPITKNEQPVREIKNGNNLSWQGLIVKIP
mgnify:CR=1 FL=1